MPKKDVPPPDKREKAVVPPAIQRAARRKAEELPRLTEELQVKLTRRGEEQAKLGSQVIEERQEAAYLIEQLNKEISRLETQIEQLKQASGTTEVLQMHEHRPKLIETFRKAKQRIILISPWMTKNALDSELRQEIENALKRGIELHIGYGFGEEDQYEERFVSRFKSSIAKGVKGHLQLYRLGDVHSKVLICDDEYMVISSFNWLSFAGDPTRGSRVEDGMLTRDKMAIANKTKEWLDRLDNLQKKPA